MRVFKKRKPEEQIYRVAAISGPLYIRAAEVVPGLLVHPGIPLRKYRDWDNPDLCCWTITHKDSGKCIVTGIVEWRWAVKAARKLNKLCSADAERHWPLMHPEWVAMVKEMQERLSLADHWPEGL